MFAALMTHTRSSIAQASTPTAHLAAAHRMLSTSTRVLAVGLCLASQAPSQSTWVEQAKILASAGDPGSSWGPVALDGDTLVIGSWQDWNGTAGGAAHVFERDPSGFWAEVAKLSAPNSEQFGRSVAMSGTTLVVGAPGGGGQKRVFVYEKDSGGAWTEVAQLTPSDSLGCGDSVAISGDLVVVGATHADGPPNWMSGAAYVFERDAGGPNAWDEVAKLFPADGFETSQRFGCSVAIQGTFVVVGSDLDDHLGGTSAGSAYVFERDPTGTTWEQVAKLVGTDTDSGDEFGTSVAISGGTAVVGVPLDNLGVAIEGLALDSSSGILFGSDVLAGHLFTLDPSSGTATLVGMMGFDDVRALAFDPGTGTLYGSNGNIGQLITIDPSTGTGVLVGSFAYSGQAGFIRVRAMALDPNTSTLFGADTASDQLITIDPSTATCTAVGAFGFGDVQGPAFDPVTGTLYGVDDASDSLIAIDTATGAGTAIGSLGMGGDFMDLTFDTATGTLYGSETLFDRLVAIDGNTGQASVAATLEGAGGVFVPGTNPPPANVGSVYVFERDQGGPGAWGQTAKLLDVQIAPNERLGTSVALSGDVLAAGAPHYPTAAGTTPGGVVVFERNAGGDFEVTAELYPPEPLGLGYSVASVDGAIATANRTEAGAHVYMRSSQTYCTAGTSASGCQALIGASGTASATASSGFSLLISGVEGQKEGLFFCGTNGRQANPWGNGTSFVCVVPPRWRAGLMTGVGTVGACDGSFSQDLNAHWCATCPKPLHNPGAGAIAQAQLWYRDPQSTSNQPTSMSDAVEFPVVP